MEDDNLSAGDKLGKWIRHEENKRELRDVSNSLPSTFLQCSLIYVYASFFVVFVCVCREKISKFIPLNFLVQIKALFYSLKADSSKEVKRCLMVTNVSCQTPLATQWLTIKVNSDQVFPTWQPCRAEGEKHGQDRKGRVQSVTKGAAGRQVLLWFDSLWSVHLSQMSSFITAEIYHVACIY